MATPKKNEAYEFPLFLVDALNPADFKANPTIAAGDFQISIDNGVFANLATLPVVQPASSVAVKVSLSAAEMNGDKVTVRAKDVAGGEWEEAVVFIDVPTVNLEGIATDVWTRVLEGALTAEQLQRILLSEATGLSTATQAPFRWRTRDLANTKDRIDGIHSDDGDRTSVTLDGT